MGNQSSQVVEEDQEESQDEEEEEEEEEDDDDEEDHNEEGPNIRELENNHLVKKVLEQEPEMLPCYASASPLSPQLSSLGTPRIGPSIKVWDPYNVLAPPPPLPPPPVFSRSYSSLDDDRMVSEVYLISHGECELNLRPDIVGGRCDGAALTSNGKRQARALAVFLNSQGIRFNAVYCSPLDRARSTALSVCQEMNFAEAQIQSSDALMDLNMGHWEGCHRSEIYTPEVLSLIERYQPDFCAPSGESLRQLEFRMVQFLNGTVLGLPEKLRSDFSLHQNDSQGFTHHNTHALTNSVHDRDVPSLQSSHWDMLQRQRPGISRKKSGKSRLQFVSNIGEHDADDEMSPREVNHQPDLHHLNVRGTSSPSTSSASTSVGVFTHSLPIKCLITGLLDCSPVMSHKICIEDSSVTVLQHSWKTGWQIKRLNDTAHLRLL
ncbi:Histidine phosphatase superfamily, clade-1 [Corchorus olitorius]|uniref:Histidine phosphatase superfamily, clade-1 n=1 Tax=Corchorus olitorius TaxID=93759 RepID=A0A1R3JWW5_9ROSI|nr:Histidine phosphatase superfamily, clade-1 [Corchorus olitorius]